ncbi:MAG: hypothetical protein ABL983_00345 [Nitrospira sp.]
MAKITPQRYECDFCEKPFKTPQAVRGHLRHCPSRRLRQQAATQAEAEPATSTVSDRASRRTGPDSQDSILLLIETHEQIQQLKEDSRTIAGMAYLLSGMNVRGEYEKAKEWLQLSQALDDVERDCDRMVGLLRLDRSLLFTIYHRMAAIRDTWIHYRTSHLKPALDGEKEQEILKEIREEDAIWSTIMTNIKKMLVASR